MRLTDREREMLNGKDGEAVKLAMEILCAVGEANGAECLIEVNSAHIVLAMYKSIFDAGVDIIEKFADLGGKFRIPTTLDPSGMDREKPFEYKTPKDYYDKQKRVEDAYQKMGAIPVWTCTPYFLGHAPRLGEHVGWTESSAVAYVNTVLGARTNRETAVLDVCIGLTGRTLNMGLHLDENRRGQVEVKLELGGRELNREEYPVLGYHLGKILGAKIGVVTGMTDFPDNDELKALVAAGAASGSLALLHIAGITPEAPTKEAAFGGREPEETIVVTEEDLAATRYEISTVHGVQDVDFVALGCPHYSIMEIKRILDLLDGRKVKEGVEFWIYATRNVTELAERLGYRQALEELGVKITLETCMIISPVEQWGFKTLMTDSAKCAYYAPMQCKANVIFGSAEDCVKAALTGKTGGGE